MKPRWPLVREIAQSRRSYSNSKFVWYGKGMAHPSRCVSVLVPVLKYEARCEVWINNDNDDDDDDDDNGNNNKSSGLSCTANSN